MTTEPRERPTFCVGCTIKLIQQPDGYSSRDYPLTMGNIYTLIGWMGSCVQITTDVPNETASVHPSRVTHT